LRGHDEVAGVLSGKRNRSTITTQEDKIEGEQNWGDEKITRVETGEKARRCQRVSPE